MSDLISRQAAIRIIKNAKYPKTDIRTSFDLGRNAGLEFASVIVEGLPTAEPKRGKWIKTARWGRVYYCNQCRNYLDFDGVNAGRGSTNFCPNCGADMRGEHDG